MHVRVLYFAAVRELLGEREAAFTLPTAVRTIQDFRTHFVECYPALRPWIASVRIARNESFAELHERLHDGDVLALIPPVSGG
ncbi:MAG: molybdopterin converting factor subunit 1 [Deltaproteobacteria bacterium]|nr:molybdopterin converting factor subunit 1 [Deltaproteobacteria bacterium]